MPKSKMTFDAFVAKCKIYTDTKARARALADFGDDEVAQSVRVFKYPNDYLIVERKTGNFCYAWAHPRDQIAPTLPEAERALWDEYAAESF
jgi:hypothetical protein